MQSGDGGSAAAGVAAVVTSVAEATRSAISALAKRAPGVAGSAEAALAVALAAEVDAEGNSATSKSMCARALLEAMDRIRAMVPEAAGRDALDDLARRRVQRLKRAGSR